MGLLTSETLQLQRVRYAIVWLLFFCGYYARRGVIHNGGLTARVISCACVDFLFINE